MAQWPVFMLNSYHLIVDLVEVNLADLVHDVLALERHKGETCFFCLFVKEMKFFILINI